MANYPFTFDSDRPLDVLGVPGRLTHRTTKPGGESGALWTRQRWISESRDAGKDYPDGARIRAEIRFDDDCSNGHNSFAITGNIAKGGRFDSDRSWLAGGCLHDEIAAAFPELAPLIRWHLCSTDGPMHGVANAIYHAGDRDCWGLRAGESRQIINGRTKQPVWTLEAINAPGTLISDTPTGEAYRGNETVPLFILKNGFDGQPDELPPAPSLRWVPSLKRGEGKARDLEAARRVAVWPEATDEQLCAEPDELRAMLEARLPGLIAEMRADLERAGFAWSPAEFTASA